MNESQKIAHHGRAIGGLKSQARLDRAEIRAVRDDLRRLRVAAEMAFAWCCAYSLTVAIGWIATH